MGLDPRLKKAGRWKIKCSERELKAAGWEASFEGH